MRTLKISLISILGVSLLFGGWYYFSTPPTPPPLPRVPNEIVGNLLKKIDNLGNEPENKISSAEYAKLKYEIEFYTGKGKVDLKWADLLYKKLDYTYTALFIKQAEYVINNTNCDLPKMAVIRGELKKLQNSIYITDQTQLDKINNHLKQYDEIVSFISNTRAFASDNTILGTYVRFDKVGTEDRMKKAKSYLATNTMARKCDRLNSSLRDIPNWMYNKNIGYLRNKLKFCKDKYKMSSSYSEYRTLIYIPLITEIDELDNNQLKYPTPSDKIIEDVDPLKEELEEERVLAVSTLKPN